MKCLASVLMTLLSGFALAQAAPTTTATGAEAGSPAKSIGMYAYPKNEQNAEQQLQDESQCYGSAKQQTGVDPQSAAPAAPSAEQQKADQEKAAQQAGSATPKGG